MKPPIMLIVAIRTDMPANISTKPLGDPICKRAPIIMMPEMALVTAIKGVYVESGLHSR